MNQNTSVVNMKTWILVSIDPDKISECIEEIKSYPWVEKVTPVRGVWDLIVEIDSKHEEVIYLINNNTLIRTAIRLHEIEYDT